MARVSFTWDRIVDAGDITWFRRGPRGLGHIPQTWQGWAGVGVFVLILVCSVEIMQAFLAEAERGQSIVFVVAAIEIMAFMKFVRRRAATINYETGKDTNA